MGVFRPLLFVAALSACTDHRDALRPEAEQQPALDGSVDSPARARALPGARVFAPGEQLLVRLAIEPEALAELEEHGDREEYWPATVELRAAAGPPAQFAQIGVRHKGSYSLHHCWDEFGGVRSHADECAKLSLKLKFDLYDDEQRFDGLKRLNLHSASADPTKLHELLAYELFRDFGVDAPRAIPAQVFVNDELWGLFIAVEDVDGRYAQAHFPGGPDGNLYKEVWPHPRFTDTELQATLETNEEVGDVADLRAFATAVSGASADTFAADLAPFIDLDQLLRYVAVDQALRNWDGVMAFYSPRSSHNFFWYHDSAPGGRFHLIPWDLDQTFWAFHPYSEPQQWVTAPPVPGFNSRPLHCDPRPIWEANGSETITPPRCDKLLNLLAETRWQRLVEIGRELLDGPLAARRLQLRADELAARLAPLVETDPTLDVLDWRRALSELTGIIEAAGPSFEAFLAGGLIEETPLRELAPPAPAELDAVTPDGGLLIGGITNFEFAITPSAAPAGVFTYADPLATVSASWSTEQALSGSADLRFDFTFQRGPGLYDEWAGVGIGGPESDVSSYSAVVVWMSSDRPREVRLRLDSPVYEEEFGGILGEFGVDHAVDTTPRPYVIDFQRVYYPSWAKDDWLAGQGFAGGDAQGLARVLQRFTGLVFGPAASVDSSGELESSSESGFLRIDNIYFR